MIGEISFWCLVVYGITQIIVESQLFKPLRVVLDKIWFLGFFAIMVSCMICTATWVSFVLSLTWWSPSLAIGMQFDINGHNVNWFIDGMFGSCVIWFVSLIEKILIAYRSKLIH
jgi:hypothetical protein